jgi:hypothetical protein
VSFHNITGIQDVLLFHQILEDHTKIWRQLWPLLCTSKL